MTSHRPSSGMPNGLLASRFAALGGASLRTRLVALSLAAILPGLAVVGFTAYEIDRSRRAEVRDMARHAAQQAAFEVERIIAEVRTLLVAVSHVPDIRNVNVEACGAYLMALRAHVTNLTALSLRDRDGRLLCASATPASPDFDAAGGSYFGEALARRDAVVGEFRRGRLSGLPTLPIALAVRDADDHVRGALVAGIDLTWLSERLKQRGVPPGGSLTIADRSGVIIARQPIPERFVGTRIPQEYMRLVHAAAPGTEELISQDGTLRVLGYVPARLVADGIYVSAGLSAEASYEAVTRAARIGMLLILLGTAATVTATWLVGQSAFIRPIKNIAAVIARWRAGDRTARTGLGDGSGEIAALGATLDRMMDETIKAQRQSELLTRELDHRVKNTWSTVQAIASLTLNKTAPGKDLLEGFTRRLMALSRAHDVLVKDRGDSASLRELIRETTLPLCDRADERLALNGPDVEIGSQEALALTLVLHELCTNAVKYGALSTPSGHVDISWTVDMAKRNTIELAWREIGGPPVAVPERTGFGTKLMARAFADAGAVEVAFAPTGVVARIAFQRMSADASDGAAPQRTGGGNPGGGGIV